MFQKMARTYKHSNSTRCCSNISSIMYMGRIPFPRRHPVPSRIKILRFNRQYVVVDLSKFPYNS